MRDRPIRTIGVLSAITFAVACTEPPTEPVLDFENVSFSIAGGDGQVGIVGHELSDPLIIKLQRGEGEPVRGVLVSFRVVEGGGSMYAGTSITDPHGKAQDYWTLGMQPGQNAVEVRAVDPTDGTKMLFGSFTATAVLPPPEVCNGVDDDLDGKIDDGLVYCLPGGNPAPNTDGANDCLPGWIDENADPEDGCEALPSPSSSWLRMTSPTAYGLVSVWGTSATNVYAVGWNGTILHYDGSSWAMMTSGTTEDLWGVTGTSPIDVYAVGNNGTILYYNGTDWAAQPSGTSNALVGIWGTSPTDIFAVGSSFEILHYNGTAWTSQPSGMSGTAWLTSVWGTSATNVYAVGGGGTILHYNGTQWVQQSSGTSGSDDNLSGIWGTSATNVYAVGQGGMILHYNGTEWTEQPSGTTSMLRGVWGRSEIDVFAMGDAGTILHYDGTSWAAMTSGITELLWGVWGTSLTDVFAVGYQGVILHYDGPTG
ncbi:WD40/YVTN/BNR-like repeat-containing protein [Gemmatimonadota bacterium]